MARVPYYLGLSVTYHDSALALLDSQGYPLFAEATERYLQTKRALNAEPDQLYRLPEILADHCREPADFVVALNWRRRRPLYETTVSALGILRAEGLWRRGLKELRSPLPNRHIHHMMACQRNSIAKGALNTMRVLGDVYPGSRVRLIHFDHHATHAASACYASPFDDAVCAVVDSYGERGALAFYHFRNGRLKRLHEARGLGSLGLYFMKLTDWCGFDWLKGEEWKVMGLAAYGRSDETLYRLLSASIRVAGLSLRQDGPALRRALNELSLRARKPGEPPECAADLAATGQRVFAERMTEILNNLHALGLSENLALAGGCALNSSFNGEILRRTPFRRLYIPPAPADDGTALGAAYLACARDRPLRNATLSPYLGSGLSGSTLDRLIRYAGGLEVRHYPATIAEETALRLAEGKLIGWVQGRAEFGPRALGNRSILADPRDAGMKDEINRRVKLREEYRPFAPAVLEEHGDAFFQDYQPSPYMERALRFRPEAARRVPAVVHVDGTGRLQTVRRDWNPRFHRLIEYFYRLTGVPLVLNTSFNLMGKPIIHSVEDAVGVFLTTGLDILVLGEFLFAKPRP